MYYYKLNTSTVQCSINSKCNSGICVDLYTDICVCRKNEKAEILLKIIQPISKYLFQKPFLISLMIFHGNICKLTTFNII